MSYVLVYPFWPAVTPGTPQIQLHRTHITVRASFPPSHKHFELDRLTVRCAGTDCETEKEVNDRSNDNVRIDGLKPPNSYQLTTAAYYPDDEVILSTSRTHRAGQYFGYIYYQQKIHVIFKQH